MDACGAMLGNYKRTSSTECQHHCIRSSQQPIATNSLAKPGMPNGWKKNASGLSRKAAIGSSSWVYCRCGHCQQGSGGHPNKPWQLGYVQRQWRVESTRSTTKAGVKKQIFAELHADVVATHAAATRRKLEAA